MSDGALKDYKFSQKNNWRWLLWKDIAKRVNPKTARVLLMPGQSCNDLFNLLALKFKLGNVVALERDKQVAKSIRKKFGVLTLPLDTYDFFALHYPNMQEDLGEFDVVALDFCGGFTLENSNTIWRAAATSFCLKNRAVLAVNFLRGRDDIAPAAAKMLGSTAPIHRGLAALVHLQSRMEEIPISRLSVHRPKFRTYSSGLLKYDSLVATVIRSVPDSVPKDPEEFQKARMQCGFMTLAMESNLEASYSLRGKSRGILSAAKAVQSRLLVH